jgi:bifunctional non-homologous end joining protein LigD
MILKEYRAKRDFRATPEPQGTKHREKDKPAAKGGAFIVQQHAARRLHYDLRLELNGVLASWAVPKGPCFDPREKRLAVQVEDHPLEYGQFEGTIPKGEYGGGTVMLWDRGEWTPITDPKELYTEGKLKFTLDGEKLHGAWMLVRIKSRERSDKPNWLLIKERDEFARPLAEGDILEEETLSVKTGRSMEEIAANANPKRKRGAKGNPKRKRASYTNPKRKRGSADADSASPDELPGAELKPLPKRLDAQLASLADAAPAGDEWLHELKFDGYRMFCRIENGKAKFFSRNHQDWTVKMGDLPTEALKLPVKQAILDGEVVVLDEGGVSDFQRLQNAFKEHASSSLIYFVFDVLHLEGVSLVKTPLEDRKKVLELLLQSKASPRIRLSEHVIGQGPEFLDQACKAGLEGIISKRRDAIYSPGRSALWLKSKCGHGQELVIGGFTDPQGSRTGIGSLMLGYYEPDGSLVYAGRVGTGFDRRTLGDLRERLEKLEQKACSFAHVERSERAGAHWVAPKLVAQIEFANWTSDGRVRQAVYHGLREDKPASKVVRESARGVRRTRKQRARDAESHAMRDGKSKRSAGRSQSKSAASAVPAVRLTNPDRVLYPETGLTKRGLFDYYTSVAEWMLPQIVDRPLSLLRCPNGRKGACFFQKRPPQGLSQAVKRMKIRIKEETAEHLIVNDLEGVLSLVQFGALELHAWGSRAKDVGRPDRIVFDLDPDEALPWSSVVDAAELLRDLLAEFDWESFVKTTGGKGLHVVAPLSPKHEWPEVKAFAKSIADLLAAVAPDRYTSTVSKAARGGKIFVDYLRNDRGSTSVVAYSTRARENAPVSMPVSWRELRSLTGSRDFNVENAPARLASLKHDPWAEINSVRQSITATAKKRLSRR